MHAGGPPCVQSVHSCESGRCTRTTSTHLVCVWTPCVQNVHSVKVDDAELSFERSRAPRVVGGVKCGEHLGPDEVFTHLLR
eukprot:6101172-Prymnesium_polylepis.1